MNLTTPIKQQEQSNVLVTLLKAAGDDLRLNILRVLNRDSFGVLELCTVFNIKQSALSHHLKLLSQAGLVATRRDGNSIFYRRANSTNELINAIFSACDQLSLDDELQIGIKSINAEREKNSKLFFQDNADKFQQQQDLIAGTQHYGNAVAELISLLFTDKSPLALELGPGEGDFLAELSQRFEQVVAIDNSQDMLKRCEQKKQELKLNNIDLLLGDTQTAINQKIQADCVVMNMVLHHTPEPQSIIQDLSKSLKAGGHLIICDLCQHDQSWARENCGDIWLGFEEKELNQWASQAKLHADQSSYLTLRNGFRIQIKHFIKSETTELTP